VSATPTPVTLPHDALRDADRSPDVPGKGAGAYYPPGAYTYLKTFDAPTDWADRAVRLEFQGAFRHAMVFVNDEFADNRADGYARFFVDIKPYLRFGDANEVSVEVRSGQDSRWYSGCGLHRPVVLHVDDPVHILPDGVRVTTLDVEPDQAVVEVATRVTNQTPTTTTATLSTTVAVADGRPVDVDESPVTLAPGETALVRHRMYLPDPRRWRVAPLRRRQHARGPLGNRFGVTIGGPDHLRRTDDPGRPAPGPADQRRTGPAAGGVPPPRQRTAGSGGHRPRRGAPDRAAPGRRVQRHPVGAQPPLGGDARGL
jgi:hypothetical protein